MDGWTDNKRGPWNGQPRRLDTDMRAATEQRKKRFKRPLSHPRPDLERPVTLEKSSASPNFQGPGIDCDAGIGLLGSDLGLPSSQGGWHSGSASYKLPLTCSFPQAPRPRMLGPRFTAAGFTASSSQQLAPRLDCLEPRCLGFPLQTDS